MIKTTIMHIPIKSVICSRIVHWVLLNRAVLNFGKNFVLSSFADSCTHYTTVHNKQHTKQLHVPEGGGGGNGAPAIHGQRL